MCKDELKGSAPKNHQYSGDMYALTLSQLDRISRKRGWKSDGMIVAYLLFAEKFGWTPNQVRSLTPEELDHFLAAFF